MLDLIELREPEQARGAMCLAYAMFLGMSNENRLEDQLLVTERAAELARRLGNMSLLAEALLMRAERYWVHGRLREHLATLQEVRRLCEANGYLGLLVPVLVQLQIAHCLRGEPDQQRLFNAHAQEIAEQIGDPALRAMNMMAHCWYAFYIGDWQRAQADVTQAIQIAPHIVEQENSVVVWQGHLHLVRGAWPEAVTWLERAIAMDSQENRWPQRLMAEKDLQHGRPAAALARLQPFLTIGEAHTWATEEVITLAVGAWAHLELGHADEAEALSAHAVARATAEADHKALPEALRVRGLVLTEHGRWDKAAQVLAEGIELARRTCYPYEEARMLAVCGRLHTRKGENAPARERLEEALAIFRRLGAPKDIERVEQQLADLARSPA